MRAKILPKRRPIGWIFHLLTVPISLCLLAAGTTSSIAQVLQLRYTFEDSGTTAASDVSGALSVPLNLFNFAGAATDLHGAANSGVQNQGHSLDLSSATNGVGSVINGPIALATNNATLGTLGMVSNFTMAVWFKEDTIITNTQNRGGRLIIMGTNGVVDNNATANDIELHYQTTNALYARINSSVVSAALYANPLPTNVWLFVAVTYDGTNDVRFYFGTEASPAKLVGIRSIGAQIVDFGSGGGTGNLILGNRPADRARAFDGWMDEFRFYTGTGDSNFVESIRQASTPVLVTGLYPDGMNLMQGTNTLAFNVGSANGIAPSGIKVAVNGTDVSSTLMIGGSSTSRTVSYTNLPVNPILLNNASLNAVQVNIQITDSGGIVTSNIVTYDAFSPANFTWECEDFDYAADPINGPGGMYIDNPRYAFESASDTYWQRQGQPPVDYSDNTGPQSDVYRGPLDLAATEFSVGNGANGGPSVSDMMRQKVLDALVLDTHIREVDVGFFDSGNWMNYTRTFPTGPFNLYVRAAYGGGGPGNSTFEQVTSGVGTPTQTTNTLGAFQIPNSGGWQSYVWAPLRDASGNLVRLDLNGVETFRLSARANGGGNNNFLMLTPANTNLPVVSGFYPNGTNMFQPSPTFSFNASSPIGATINATSIRVTLTITTVSSTVVTNLTSTNGLTISGTASSKNVSCALVTNATCTAVVSVTDANGSPAGATVNFDTYNPVFLWEAEDYNYNAGAYIDTPETNGYAGQVGVVDIDYHDNVTVSQNGNPAYRTGDAVGLEINGDAPPRLPYINSGFTDYDVGWYDNGNWNNYTRTLPAGDYNVILRAANGTTGNGGLGLARVTSDPTMSNQTTVVLGNFTIPATGGWQTYTWVPMRDGNGNLVKFTGGGIQTLRATASGGLNANFYMLIPANTNLPLIGNIYPNGTNLFQQTNRLTFSVTSSAGVTSNSISVTLDGNLATGLTFSGSPAAWNVSYLGLTANTNHGAVISATDVNGNNATASVTFDTFPAGLFTWEAEDYDHDSGQFIDNPPADAYFGLNATADVDFHDVNLGGIYAYRPSGTATETVPTPGRPQYAATNDWAIGFFGAGEWGNYTRNYPAGRYYPWGQFAAGGGDTSATLSIVTTGWGTTIQDTNFLGTFSVGNSSWTSYTWVPMRDAGGNLAKVALNGSTNTLKLTRALTGPDVNVDFFMLVPAPSPAATTLTATPSGANINLSFPTQTGFTYQIQYKNDLSDPSWISLGNAVPGDGTVMTVSDPAGGPQRFYRLFIL